MKIKLTRQVVAQLSISHRPSGAGSGVSDKFEDVRDTKELKPYVVFDATPGAPTGFGLKVSRESKSYILQRRVTGPDGKSTIKRITIGKDGPGLTLAEAREQAGNEASYLRKEGKSKKQVLAEEAMQIPTLGVAFEKYKNWLRTRKQKKAKESSIKNLDGAIRKLEIWGWIEKPINQFTSVEIIAKFNEEHERHPAMTEQVCRWAHSAVKHAIDLEIDSALTQKRTPLFEHNPFAVLYSMKYFRSKEALEKHYIKNRSRNPLNDKTMGAVLDVVWERRRIKNNRTACDYLLMTLMMGNRRSELYQLRWADFDDLGGTLNDVTYHAAILDCAIQAPANTEAPFVYLPDTKNRSDHILPLVGAALEIIKQRKRERDEHVAKRLKMGLKADDPKSIWVFPARSKRSKLGHYTDSKAILSGIKKDARLDFLRTHDLRRTLSTYADRLRDPSMVKRLLNHKNLSDATTAYPQIPWEDVCQAMLKVQILMLKNHQDTFIALMPAGTAVSFPNANDNEVTGTTTR